MCDVVDVVGCGGDDMVRQLVIDGDDFVGGGGEICGEWYYNYVWKIREWIEECVWGLEGVGGRVDVGNGWGMVGNDLKLEGNGKKLEMNYLNFEGNGLKL